MSKKALREALSEAEACMNQSWEHLNYLNAVGNALSPQEIQDRLKTLRGVLTDVQDNIVRAIEESDSDD